MIPELFLGVLGLVGRVVAVWSRPLARPFAVAVGGVAVVAGGFRDWLRAEAVHELGERWLVGWSADAHADAARVLALGGVILAVFGTEPELREVQRLEAVGAALAVVAGLLGGPWALLAALLAVASVRIAVPRLPVAAAVLAGATEGLFRALGLFEPGDHARFLPALVGVGVAALAAALLAARQRPHWTGAVGPAALVVTLLLGTWTASDYGPNPGLDAALAVDLPVAEPRRPWRMAYGCLVVDGRVRALAGARTPACPDLRGFPPGKRTWIPIFAAARDASVRELAPAEGGDVDVLVRLPGLGLDRWRLARVQVPVWELEPRVPAYAPLARVVVGQPVADAAALAVDVDPDAPHRVDVVVTERACPTVGCLVDLCLDVERRHPVAVRCGLGAGDPDRWVTTPPPPVPDLQPDATQDAEPLVIEDPG